LSKGGSQGTFEGVSYWLLDSPDCDYKDYGENYHSQVGAPEGGKTWEDELEAGQYRRLADPPTGDGPPNASNSTNSTVVQTVLRAPMEWHVCQNEGLLRTLRAIDRLKDYGLSATDFIERFVLSKRRYSLTSLQLCPRLPNGES
jgi:hypothetical protein